MNKKCLVVVANYYENISKSLLNNALNILKKKYQVKVIYVPGVFEIPVTISRNISRFHGFIALGCVIKGQTPHFEFISRAVITCHNMKQAIARGKKGAEAAKAVISVLIQ